MNSYEKIGRILRLPPSYEHVCRIAFCKISRVRLLMSVLYSYFMPVWRNFSFCIKTPSSTATPFSISSNGLGNKTIISCLCLLVRALRDKK